MTSKKNIRIIFEGSDGSGKSTWAHRVLEVLQSQMDDSGRSRKINIVDLGGSAPMTDEFCQQTLLMPNTIWDRHFVSENIYSAFYNKEKRLKDLDYMVSYCKDNNIPILVFIPENHILEDGEDSDIVNRHQELVEGYISFCKRYDINPIDSHNIDISYLMDIINKGLWYNKESDKGKYRVEAITSSFQDLENGNKIVLIQDEMISILREVPGGVVVQRQNGDICTLPNSVLKTTCTQV